MRAVFTLLFLFVGVDESAKDAGPSSQPNGATSQPALDIEFRPVRIIDHREKNLSDLFPAKPRKPADVPAGAGPFKIRIPARPSESGTDARQGLTIRFELTGGSSDCELLLRKVRIEEATTDEGEWSEPFKRAWFEEFCLDRNDFEEQLRFSRQHGFDDEDGLSFRASKIELDFKRPPRQARLISKLRGLLELDITTIRAIAIDLDQTKFGERVDNAELKKAGLKLKMVDPKKTEHADRDDIDSGKYTVAEISGSIDKLVKVYIAEAPAQEGEIAGPELSYSSTSSSSSALFGPGGTRSTLWHLDKKRPKGARLVLRIVEGRRTQSHPFEIEEIPLPK